jgi:hypothetical protein
MRDGVDVSGSGGWLNVVWDIREVGADDRHSLATSVT